MPSHQSSFAPSWRTVVRKTHHDYIAVRPLLTPCLDPQVKYVMKIDVRQERRGTAALGRPFRHPYPFPILQHAGAEPFLDQAHDAPICDPVLDEFHQPFVLSAHWMGPSASPYGVGVPK